MIDLPTIIIEFLAIIPAYVVVVALSILLGSWLVFMIWFRKRTAGLVRVLRSLANSLAEAPGNWETANGIGQAASQENPAVADAWSETEERVISLPNDQRTVPVMLGAPRDLWSSHFLLGRQLNLALADAVPNLLVGIGLLFTFLFLSLALTTATRTLGNGVDPTEATRSLLQTAGAKFITSLAGLFASILWTWRAKAWIAKLDRAAEEVLRQLSKRVRFGGGEIITFADLQASRDLNETSQQHLLATQNLGGLTEELLNEAREQTGTFKRFETDLAVSLAGAITQAFSPQMEIMTNRLITAIDGLSDKIGTMNQEALERMLVDFSGMLKQMTESEMTQLRKTLESLADRLDGAGNVIEKGAGEAADKLDKVGSELLARVEHISASLVTGATNIDTAAQSVKEALNDLDVTISEAAEVGKQGATFVRGALETSTSIIDRLKSALADLSAATGAMERVSGQLSNAVDNVEELAQEQRLLVTAVKEATPNALTAIQRMQTLLQDAIRETVTITGQIEKSMQSTSAALGSTVASITEGISEYSGQVAALHQSMDAELAKAVGSLERGTTSLEEAIEELNETLSSRIPKN